MAPAHPIARRFWAEDLVRLRRADERRRYLASQRAGRVDPNPHQIDAVIFALGRIRQGGCILADEVGLGKTIEAGLTMAQLLAEGASRILLITPKPLVGQWQAELRALFGLDAVEGAGERGLDGPGVFVVGREYAGSEKGAAALEHSGRFDLCVIDEAHEIFAGIYRRYDRHGRVRDESRYARLAARVKRALGDSPVLLLTATPIQNTLTELWGLVQYVEPTSTLLGDLPTFRTVFCDGDDRTLRPGQGAELKRRIAEVCQRTLRRQAQEFMEQPFRQRSARLLEYSMSADEQSLYDDVTAYLLDPKTRAFSGAHRRLLLISFHRRMGSSLAALADSLATVAERLRRKLRGPDGKTLSMFATDLEEETPSEPESAESEEPESGGAPKPSAAEEVLLTELRRVDGLVERAKSLADDAKADRLVSAVTSILERARNGEGSGKVVIFTEALSTQDYLRERLVASGLVGEQDVTLFRGQNTGARASEALAHWEDEVGSRQPAAVRPSKTVATRLALVHEFQTRSAVFISTEAGAKGLNLQFCENVINYDLPWNPQRIEQRIGRCHRYGQTRDVTVVNFLCRGNEAQRLTFDILSRKLDLFGTVLDASDAILHESSGQGPGALVGVLASDFEDRLADVYTKARDLDELNAGLASLEAELATQRTEFEDTHARTAGLIESRFDQTVRAAFKRLADDVEDGLADLDRDLQRVLTAFFVSLGVEPELTQDEERVFMRAAANAGLPEPYEAEGVALRIGRAGGDDEAYEPAHIGHRLVRAALEEARRSTAQAQRVRIFGARTGPFTDVAPETVGRLWLARVHHDGFEPTVALLPVVTAEGLPQPVYGEAAAHLFGCEIVDTACDATAAGLDDELQGDALDEALFVCAADVAAREHESFESAVGRIERAMDDRILALERRRIEVDAALAEAQRARDAAVGGQARTRAESECRTLETELEGWVSEIDRLRRRDDEDYQTWRLRALAKRYAKPSCEKILDVEFVFA